jgi:ABC-2 type transport system ATP-binding protein
MRNPIIELIDVSKVYSGKKVLKNVSFKFRNNLIYGIVGPNGVGKTTILKAILSFIKYKGEIRIEDRNPDGSQLRISYVPEIIEFYNYLTGMEAVKLITAIQGFDSEEMCRNFNKNAFYIGYRDHGILIKQHSKGNLRKLMLLQSLSVPTKLLLFDEPFSSLDPISIEKLKKLFAEQKNNGVTIVLNTHLYEVAKKICDEIIFLCNGEIKYCANKAEFSSIDLLEMYEVSDNIK